MGGSEAGPQSHPARPGQARSGPCCHTQAFPSLCSPRFTICLKCFLFPQLFFPLVYMHQIFLVRPPEGAGPEVGLRALGRLAANSSQNTGTDRQTHTARKSSSQTNRPEQLQTVDRHRDTKSYRQDTAMDKLTSREGQHAQGAVLTQPGDRCREIRHTLSYKPFQTEATDRHVQRSQLSIKQDDREIDPDDRQKCTEHRHS